MNVTLKETVQTQFKFKAVKMKGLSWIFPVGPKSNCQGPYKREAWLRWGASGYRRGESDVMMQAKAGVL